MGFLSANHGNLARHGTTAPALDWRGPSRGDCQGTRLEAQRLSPPTTVLFTGKSHTKGLKESPSCIPGTTRLSTPSEEQRVGTTLLSLPQPASLTDPTLPTYTFPSAPSPFEGPETLEAMYPRGTEMHRVVIQGHTGQGTPDSTD